MHLQYTHSGTYLPTLIRSMSKLRAHLQRLFRKHLELLLVTLADEYKLDVEKLKEQVLPTRCSGAKRPPSKWNCFVKRHSKDMMAVVKRELPDLPHKQKFGEVTKRLAAKWKRLSDEQKAMYQERPETEIMRARLAGKAETDDKDLERKYASPTPMEAIATSVEARLKRKRTAKKAESAKPEALVGDEENTDTDQAEVPKKTPARRTRRRVN